MTAGAYVRSLRLRRGMTREQLAVEVGISNSTLARLELNDTVPKHEIMRALAGVLDVPVADLYAADERESA